MAQEKRKLSDWEKERMRRLLKEYDDSSHWNSIAYKKDYLELLNQRKKLLQRDHERSLSDNLKKINSEIKSVEEEISTMSKEKDNFRKWLREGVKTGGE